MPQLKQVRLIEFSGEEIGMGFNSQSGLAVGTALEGFTVGVDPVVTGQQVIASIKIISSHEELMKSLDMSFEAQGRYGTFSGSAKAEFSESSNYNSTSTFLVARVRVQNPITRGKNFHVTPTAQQLLDTLHLDEFNIAFGDSFVRGLKTGGEFYCVIRITSVSTSTQSNLAASLQAECNGLVASGSFKAAFSEANSSSSTRSEFSATMFQRAGNGAEISPTVGIDETITRYKNFPEIAKNSSFAFESEIATYNTIPLPLPTAEEQDDFLIALQDAREKKLNYIQARNDLEFAAHNSYFFKNLPPSEVLNSSIDEYTRLINAVINHAVKLSQGQMKPPRLFNPSELIPPLREPTPIILERATLQTGAPTIKVPSFIGMNNQDLEFALRCLEVGTVDECLAGTVFLDQDGNPSPIRCSRDVAEFLYLTQHGQLILKRNPDTMEANYTVNAQFPFAGTFTSTGSEILLQFQEEPIT